MDHGTGLSRGDRRRNERREALRAVVRPELAICAIDLADKTQAIALCDHDGRVLARRSPRCRAWQLQTHLAWARDMAVAKGFAGIVVGCEPTGHRWHTIAEQCDALGVELVCVQPLLVHRERERDDFTRDRSDPRDAVLIAALVADLRCYRPQRQTEPWARLRHLGIRRQQLITVEGAARQRVRSLLECAWPAALDAAAQPLDSKTWQAAMTVTLVRCGGDLARVRRLGQARWHAAVKRELAPTRIHGPIARAIFAAAADPDGVPAQRAGALERAGMALVDLAHTQRLLDDVEQRMLALLDDLDLTALAGSITGVSTVGAAAILAETGDLHAYGSARAVVKHAGLCPRDNTSGTFAGATKISGRGRPRLRLAAWRAVWGALPHNPVYAARYTQLTTRPVRPLTDHQARVAIAGALLRQLHAVITTATPWDATIAAPAATEDRAA